MPVNKFNHLAPRINKTLRDLEDNVVKYQDEVDAYRAGQKTKTRQLKNTQKKYDELNDIAYDPQTSWADSQNARAQRDGLLGPKRRGLERQLEAYPEKINLAEVKLIKAQDALREYKAVSILPASAHISFISLTSKPEPPCRYAESRTEDGSTCRGEEGPTCSEDARR